MSTLTYNPIVTKDTRSFFRINEYPYKIIQITPERHIKNKLYEEVVNSIYSLYKDPSQYISFDKGIEYTKPQPICYEILYSGKNITFNIAVNEKDMIFIKNRLQAIFPDADLIVLENDYISNFKDSYVYKYNYDRHYLCSMATQYEKSPINSLIALKKDIQDTEQVLIQVAINPLNKQKKVEMNDLWDKVKKGQDILNRQTFGKKLMEGIFDFIDESLNVFDEVIGTHPTKENEKEKTKNKVRALLSDLNSETRQKPNYDQFKCEFKTYVKTDNETSSYSIGKSIETAYKDMGRDNQLLMVVKPKIVKEKDLIRKHNPFKPNNNILSTLELGNIMKLPDGISQRMFGLRSMNRRQISPPKEMLKGKIALERYYKNGECKNVYMSEDRDLSCLPLFLCTKMGGGKTTFLLHLCNEVIKEKHGLVLFDYIKNCDLAKALVDLQPDTFVVKFDEIETLLTFAFPEIQILDTDSPYKRKLTANVVANEVKYLLNAMAKDTEPMSRIMSQYLMASCKVVFIHNNKTLKDVLNVLTNKDIRDRYIKLAIEQNVFTSSSYEILSLQELDDKTGHKRLDGLLDRFSIITEDTLFQEMLEKPSKCNVNFVDIMDKGKPIAIMMPQNIFTNKITKDVICTYFMSRIRLAMSKRKNFDNIAHVIIDELHQVPQTIELISDTIAEPRKFSLNYVMTMHSFSQIQNKTTREKILDVGCNFMLLKGCSKSAFDELSKMNIISEDFEFDNISEMEYPFGALNLFSVNNQYKGFIAELPPALRNSRGELYIGK